MRTEDRKTWASLIASLFLAVIAMIAPLKYPNIPSSLIDIIFWSGCAGMVGCVVWLLYEHLGRRWRGTTLVLGMIAAGMLAGRTVDPVVSVVLQTLPSQTQKSATVIYRNNTTFTPGRAAIQIGKGDASNNIQVGQETAIGVSEGSASHNYQSAMIGASPDIKKIPEFIQDIMNSSNAHMKDVGSKLISDLKEFDKSHSLASKKYENDFSENGYMWRVIFVSGELSRRISSQWVPALAPTSSEYVGRNIVMEQRLSGPHPVEDVSAFLKLLMSHLPPDEIKGLPTASPPSPKQPVSPLGK